ncbi:MAG: spermidine/putrescine ABC transporter permease PotC, partial [Sphaerospermopsis sp. SIO1G2]|nr:spermidine/putrescine ABC transporter permease PotC [Sphaerospermopsis sp. SIO1G2]
MAAATLTRNKVRKSFNERILTWLAIGMFLFLYLPIVILIIYSFNDSGRGAATVWQGFTFSWYTEVFTNTSIINAARVSLWVAFWSTVVSTILGTLTAIAMERFKFRGKVTYDAI